MAGAPRDEAEMTESEVRAAYRETVAELAEQKAQLAKLEAELAALLARRGRGPGGGSLIADPGNAVPPDAESLGIGMLSTVRGRIAGPEGQSSCASTILLPRTAPTVHRLGEFG